MNIDITIVADQEAFFADADTPTHPPQRWIQAKGASECHCWVCRGLLLVVAERIVRAVTLAACGIGGSGHGTCREWEVAECR